MKFKGFFTDYIQVSNAIREWLKKHWLAYIVYVVIMYAIAFMTAVIYYSIRFDITVKEILGDLLYEIRCQATLAKRKIVKFFKGLKK